MVKKRMPGLNGRLALAISAAALGSSFQHGYNTGVVNAPQKVISQFMNETFNDRHDEYMTTSQVTGWWSLAVSIYCVGGIIGGLMTGIIADRLGRKSGLLWNNVTAIVGVVLEVLAKYTGAYEILILGRLIIGFNSGLNAGLCPMYLAEIAPQHLRGAIGTVYQLVVTISILFSQILGLEFVMGTELLWPWLLGVALLPAIFQLSTLPVCPESPKYILINQGKEIEAQNALTWFRGTLEVHEELDEIKAESEAMKLVPKVTLGEMFTSKTMRMPLIIACMMMLAQQLSGINAVFFFSNTIFASAGLSAAASQYATLGVGVMNVLMTFVSMAIVEKAGRKTLLLTGFIGMMINVILLYLCLQFQSAGAWISYVSILWVILFVVMFAVGPGSIPWFLVSELFSQGARPLATSMAVGINWGANFMVGLMFLPLKDAMGPAVFLIFVVLLALFSTFIYFKVPETKNKTIEEINDYFQ